jgi:hypothetical protein
MKVLTTLAAADRRSNAPSESLFEAFGVWIKEIFEY